MAPPPVCNPGKTFADIKSEKTQAAIEALASRGIINGTSSTSFEPGRTITRAEFAAIVVQALGLPPAKDIAFTDVPKKSWYAAAVSAACEFGIVRGTSETAFSPGTAITREQAAVMAARAAELCGMQTALSAAEIRDTLAQFPDHTACAAWARESLAFCYRQNILSPDVLQCKPQEAVTRAEVAGMIHQVLQKAALL